MKPWRTIAGAAAIACSARCAPRLADAVVWAGADAGDGAVAERDSASPTDGGPLVWPDPEAGHTANSDPWIAQNHDAITVMRPEVLLLDFANTFYEPGVDGGAPVLVEAGYPLLPTVEPLIQEHVAAFEVASRYQGYKEPDAPPFLQYRVRPEHVIDLRDDNGQVNSSSLPIANGSVDYGELNSDDFAQRMGIRDDAGTLLDLCELFERGLINEVWGMAADPLEATEPPSVKFASFVETKQVYDSNDVAIAGVQACTSTPGAPCLTETLSCGVTVRFFDFNPGRGAGCHLFASGLEWPQYVEPSSAVLPALKKVAQTFFNFDFEARFGAPFSSFFEPCQPSGDGGTCIDWTTPGDGPFTGAISGPASSQSFSFNPLTAGCGSVVFPPNATAFSLQAGDLPVLSSCESYGLGDATTAYTNQRVAGLYPPGVVSDCGGAQPVYLLASMPGLGTKATAADGTPMKNWWVYPFY